MREVLVTEVIAFFSTPEKPLDDEEFRKFWSSLTEFKKREIRKEIAALDEVEKE